MIKPFGGDTQLNAYVNDLATIQYSKCMRAYAGANDFSEEHGIHGSTEKFFIPPWFGTVIHDRVGFITTWLVILVQRNLNGQNESKW